jgi:hypothetical protein
MATVTRGDGKVHRTIEEGSEMMKLIKEERMDRKHEGRMASMPKRAIRTPVVGQISFSSSSWLAKRGSQSSTLFVLVLKRGTASW